MSAPEMSGAKSGLGGFFAPRDSEVEQSGAVLVICLGGFPNLANTFISDDDDVDST